MASRKFFVGGNWKMNGSIAKIDGILNFLNNGDLDQNTDVVCAPPALYVSYVKGKLKSHVQVALQNCHNATSGAFTGEVAPEMGQDLGCSWVILGHSERRHKFGETDELIGDKVRHVLTNTNMGVIACIGELLSEREENKTMDVIATQMKAIAANVSDWSRVVIAYEPVWAIGTGKVASPEQAQEVHEGVRKWLAANCSDSNVSNTTRILYGGSVNGNNCVELSKKPDIDGFLVGGAALKEEFVKIVNARK